MSYVMVCEGYASGMDCPFTGQYLEFYDANTVDGELGGWTNDLAKAKRYETAKDLLEDWRSIRTIEYNGFRPDGRRNRPLTAFSVSIKHLD